MKHWVKFDENNQPIDSSEVGKEQQDKIIHEGDMDMLIGQILTLTEISIPDSDQSRALKRSIKNTCWGMWEMLDEEAEPFETFEPGTGKKLK